MYLQYMCGVNLTYEVYVTKEIKYNIETDICTKINLNKTLTDVHSLHTYYNIIIKETN